MRHFIVATAGHVDHGKSSLVKALSGTDPDRLPEEKARQITIDLGFAELDLDQNVHASIIDVPGHEDFVRNMVAGVGSIDLALLVIAADDGWMPQTEEHLQILAYMGARHAMVALTKQDFGTSENTFAEIRQKLGGSPFADARIVAVSVRTGKGLAELKEALGRELLALPPRLESGRARVPIDRAFTLRGIGTVVTGTLSGSSLGRESAVFVQPGNISTRIRSLQSHGVSIGRAEPVARVALNLPDLQIGGSRGQISRGQCIAAQAGPAAQAIDVFLWRSDRDDRVRPLKTGSSVDLHHGTARINARLVLMKRQLAAGDTSVAELRLHSPLFAFVGDRFVLRDCSQQNTLAGGIILDAAAEAEKLRTPRQQKFLSARAHKPFDPDICLLSEVERAGVLPSEGLLAQSNFSQTVIANALARLHAAGELIVRDGITATGAVWRRLIEDAQTLIKQAHADHPEKKGLEIRRLRGHFPAQSDRAFAALVSQLCKDGFEGRGEYIACQTHRATLSSVLQASAERIEALLNEKGVDPPARSQVIVTSNDREALEFLVRAGSVVAVQPDLVFARTAYEQLESAVSAFLKARGPATISELRQHVRSSRRIMVPLLEHFDRTGLTRRSGDRRSLASN
jgi:selenocysteine-specific elongation factor